MKIYRIYTEDINRDEIIKIISDRFDGFTLLEAQGYWKGISEKSLIIEIIAYKNDIKLITEIATGIKITNKQEMVFVVELETNLLGV